jgi:hypothetical protein
MPVKGKPKKNRYRPRPINGCLAGTGLTIEPWWPHEHYEF